MKENHYDPLWNDLGRGYISGLGYYLFHDRGGDRIERIALGPSGWQNLLGAEFQGTRALVSFDLAAVRALKPGNMEAVTTGWRSSMLDRHQGPATPVRDEVVTKPRVIT